MPSLMLEEMALLATLRAANPGSNASAATSANAPEEELKAVDESSGSEINGI